MSAPTHKHERLVIVYSSARTDVIFGVITSDWSGAGRHVRVWLSTASHSSLLSRQQGLQRRRRRVERRRDFWGKLMSMGVMTDAFIG